MRRRAPEPTGSGRGWKEQVRRVSELALLGIVASALALPVLTIGAVVATLSAAAAHWVEHDELPPWRVLGAELRRRLLPGAVVSAAGLLAALVVAAQLRWLGSGAVPGGGIGRAAVLVAVAGLLGVVLLAVPRLACTPGGRGRTWRRALAEGWTDARRVPLAAAAAVGVVLLAGVLGALLGAVALVLPAFVVVALHAVHRAMVAGPVSPGAGTPSSSVPRTFP
ncbi:hypothetical protein [Pseudonocardia sp. TRM90224]|uniref:hypothetical protein n=1 Tax=Pseudonocardia sp. TRM90224 TaxID=2812678 RepID=UPI001E467893|nr:hypothetical protein [Pseudonocardia sp. TRM90224]